MGERVKNRGRKPINAASEREADEQGVRTAAEILEQLPSVPAAPPRPRRFLALAISHHRVPPLDSKKQEREC